MALYSVWDWQKNMFAVYATDKPVSVGDDPTAPKPRGSDPLGAVPDAEVKVLPRGARLLGHDRLARGEIVRLPKGPFGLGDTGQQAEQRQVPAALYVLGGAVVGFGMARVVMKGTTP